MGDDESAIVVIEKQMASHAEDPSWSNKEYRERLRELITGSAKRQGLEPRKQVEATPFARFLTKYFPANDDGRVITNWFVIGGDGEAHALEQRVEVGIPSRHRVEPRDESQVLATREVRVDEGRVSQQGETTAQDIVGRRIFDRVAEGMK